METTVNMTAGLRVAFEEGANRTTALPTGATFTVNMTDQNMASSGAGVTDNNFFGGARAIELLGTAAVNVNGSILDDLIIGNRGANTISGGAGRDIIFGGYGADILLGQAGNDVVIGGSSERVVGMSWTTDEGTAIQWGNTETRLDSVNSQTWFDMGVGVGDLKLGDKLTYNFSVGAAPTVLAGTTSAALTNGQALFVVGIDTTVGSSSYGWVKLATAANGAAVRLVTEGTTNNFSFTLENTVWTDANRPGNDYAVGGSGDDTMVAVGVVGASAAVRDTLTLSGGSGDDTFKLFGATGQINIMGGSGSDTVMATTAFGEANTLNGARMFDFSATQDTVMGQFDGTAGTLSAVGGIEGRLQLDGLRLSQLVAPPLPIVNGSGENGNYERLTSNDNAATSYATNQTFILGSETINLADILNQHLAHA
jgi:Ca2+-binding RTX toxin-like protein